MRYFKLFIVIVAGVCVGHLASTAITTVVVTHGIRFTIEDFQARVDDQRDRFQRQVEEARRDRKKERMVTAKGKRLHKRCQEWRENHDQHPTETMSWQMHKHCQAYRDYINGR